MVNLSLGLQFARPRGVLAPVAGWILYFANRRVNRWTVGHLDLRPDDEVAEIGFGPGAGVAVAAEKAALGRVAGVDPSERMVAQARRRNRRFEEAGRLDLRRGVAEDLPWPAASFTRVFTVNSIHEWSDMGRGLGEIHRILAPGGRVAVTTQARWLAGHPDRIAELGEMYRTNLEDAGFGDVGLRLTEARPTHAICLLGTKGG